MGSPPWPFMELSSPLSALLQDDQQQLHPPPLAVGSQSSNSPSPTYSSPSPLLSSHASLSSSTSKVSKRKSRAVNKPPIRVLSADRESFRDMVQKLTGIPPPPQIDLRNGMRLWAGSAGAPNSPAALYRPTAIRQRSSYPSEFAGSGSAAIAHQCLPTLDTSSAYLPGALNHGRHLMLNEVGKRDFCEMGYGSEEAASVMVAAAAPEAASYGEGCSEALDGLPELEGFLMSSSKLEELLQARLEPWFNPHVEITHSA